MNIKEELFKLQDIKYKEFHSKLCQTKKEIIGVRVPLLRKLAKELYKKDQNILEKIDDNYYEEVMLQALILSNIKMDFDEKKILIKKFVKKIDNWAICDTFCASLKIKEEDKISCFNFIKSYSKSKKEFELRFMLIMLLNYYLEEEYLDEIRDIINEIYKKDYYVLMAIAWIISFMYIKYPSETLKILNTLNIDDWTYNKSIQKIIESNRVSKKEKNYFRTIKKIAFN